MSDYHVEFDSNGKFPMYAFGSSGASVITSSKKPATSVTSVKPSQEETSIGTKWIPWGVSDTFPKDVVDIVQKTNVGRSTLHLLTKSLHGLRVVPCKIKDYDENGKEVLQYVKPEDAPEVYEFMSRTNFNRWRLKVAQDFVFFHNAFPEIIFTKDKSKVALLGHNKAAHCRYTPWNEKSKRIESMIVSANFPNPSQDEQSGTIPIIDPDNLYTELERVREEKHVKYIYPTSWPDIINNFYSLAYWDGSRRNGWMEIAAIIPKYKQALFKNSMSIKYHIEIPVSYWTSKFPDWEQKSNDERKKVVSDLQDEMNNYLTGAENAMKTFISHFSIGPDGKSSEDGWKINVLDDKINKDAYLPDASAANAEILFSMLVNPAIFGVGMPGGNYTGGANNGGSNMREGHLIMTSMLQADRDIILNIMEFVKLYNGWDMNLQFRVIDQVLTTLDKGRGTEKVLS